jgi:hypothetical protein
MIGKNGNGVFADLSFWNKLDNVAPAAFNFLEQLLRVPKRADAVR